MRLLSRISTWWRAVSRGPELDRQIDEELNFTSKATQRTWSARVFRAMKPCGERGRTG